MREYELDPHSVRARQALANFPSICRCIRDRGIAHVGLRHLSREVARGFAEAFGVLEIVTAVSALCYLLWLWSMGSFLNSLAQPVLRLRIGVFSLTVIFTSIYVFGFVALFQSVSPIAFGVIVPLLLLAAFCMFYNFYFVSKSLAIAETGKSATFNEYAGTFFLLWFYPIGIWFIQPRINRLYAKT